MKKLFFVLMLNTLNFAIAQSNKENLFLECKVTVPQCDSISEIIKNSYQNILLSRNKKLFKISSKYRTNDNFFILESYVSDGGNYYLDIILTANNKIEINSYVKKKNRLKKLKKSAFFNDFSHQSFLIYIKDRSKKPCELSSLNGKITQVTSIINGKCESFVHF